MSNLAWNLSTVPNRVDYMELWERSGWRIKLYGVNAAGGPPDAKLVESLNDILPQVLPMPAVSPARLGAGFATVFEGSQSPVIFIDWWECVNTLRSWVLEKTGPGAFRDMSGARRPQWNWEQRIRAFERREWNRLIVGRWGNQDLDGYCSTHYREPF